jgi:hypothetical protein
MEKEEAPEPHQAVESSLHVNPHDQREGGSAVCAKAAMVGSQEKTSRRRVPKNTAAKARDRIIKQIERLADGEYHSLEPAPGRRYKPPGMPLFIASLHLLALIPWLKVERIAKPDQNSRDTINIKVTIDHELRAICEDRAPRPELNYKTRAEFYKELRAHITRSRKENHDRKRQSRWEPEAISMRHQSELLDYIEDMLDRVPL